MGKIKELFAGRPCRKAACLLVKNTVADFLDSTWGNTRDHAITRHKHSPFCGGFLQNPANQSSGGRSNFRKQLEPAISDPEPATSVQKARVLSKNCQGQSGKRKFLTKFSEFYGVIS